MSLESMPTRMSNEEFQQEFSSQLSGNGLVSPTSRFDASLAELVVRWQENDELWRFSSPPETWQMMMGRGGIALVRDGRAISFIETIMH
jgi:hypothetical protein